MTETTAPTAPDKQPEPERTRNSWGVRSRRAGIFSTLISAAGFGVEHAFGPVGAIIAGSATAVAAGGGATVYHLPKIRRHFTHPDGRQPKTPRPGQVRRAARAARRAGVGPGGAGPGRKTNPGGARKPVLGGARGGGGPGRKGGSLLGRNGSKPFGGGSSAKRPSILGGARRAGAKGGAPGRKPGGKPGGPLGGAGRKPGGARPGGSRPSGGSRGRKMGGILGGGGSRAGGRGGRQGGSSRPSGGGRARRRQGGPGVWVTGSSRPRGGRPGGRHPGGRHGGPGGTGSRPRRRAFKPSTWRGKRPTVGAPYGSPRGGKRARRNGRPGQWGPNQPNGGQGPAGRRQGSRWRPWRNKWGTPQGRRTRPAGPPNGKPQGTPRQRHWIFGPWFYPGTRPFQRRRGANGQPLTRDQRKQARQQARQQRKQQRYQRWQGKNGVQGPMQGRMSRGWRWRWLAGLSPLLVVPAVASWRHYPGRWARASVAWYRKRAAQRFRRASKPKPGEPITVHSTTLHPPGAKAWAAGEAERKQGAPAGQDEPLTGTVTPPPRPVPKPGRPDPVRPRRVIAGPGARERKMAGAQGLEAVIEAMHTHIGGWQPENLEDIQQFLKGLGELGGEFQMVFATLADRMQSDMPLRPEVAEHVNEIGSQAGAALQHHGEELEQIFAQVHEGDIERISNPRPNAAILDVQSNN